MTITSRAQRPALPHWVFVTGLIGVILVIFITRPPSSGPGPDVPAVFITELAASNLAGIPDEDGHESDWIEIGNFSATTVNLDGWYLTDSFRRLKQWRFPAVELPAGGRLVVFASGKDRREATRPLHTNFKLNDRGEYLALIRPDGKTVAHELLPRYPRQRGFVTYGLRENLRFPPGQPRVPVDAYRYFTVPTPGRTNEGDAIGLVAPLKASYAGGLFERPIRVTLSTRTPGARIYYTTDGSTPSETNGELCRGSVMVRSTTVLRAIAVRPGFAPTEVVTRSFIFPAQVPHQTGEGFPGFWGYTNGQPVLADYRMTPEITGNPLFRDKLAPALHSIPTISMVTVASNLFDPANGIYSNPLKSGGEWERPASAELIYPDGRTGFQIDCGLRIQGGWNRRPEECPKHSLRLMFKKKYGTAHLHFPLFGREGTVDFQTLILRGGCNNTWLHWSGEERHRGDYVRDEWMRETSAAMGIPAARGMFVHLFLNGLYWGLYNLTERPDESFIAALQGGKPVDYDSRNADNVLSGDAKAWNMMFALANKGLTDEASYRAIAELLDLTEFSDYLLLNLYGANADWDRASNWYAARRRNPPGRFQFFVWDGERTLEYPQDDSFDSD
ncbi:MAG TPA: CotH kinase family protein, partial [Candidatus Nitrosotalea sp.]|nr:CotH kinase family protein [Candidatus Nitrosotalea sp.]